MLASADVTRWLTAAALTISSIGLYAWRRRPIVLSPKLSLAVGRKRSIHQQPLVVVIGLGGVGSHAAHLLFRSGVRRLRLVDFDQVTLSSLNRHATATRQDVGTPKAVALRAALLAVDPEADIDARVSLFCAKIADKLLEGEPALVIDAIDDLKTKAELQAHCIKTGLRVLSALGAGGKADCGTLLVTPLADVLGDPIATSLSKYLKDEAPAGEAADWWNALEHRIECVYSSEKQRVGLLPMPEGANAAELGTQPTFRVRILPVLPPVPAAFGAALATRAIDLLQDGTTRLPNMSLPTLTVNYQRRIFQQFENEVLLGMCKGRKGRKVKTIQSNSREGSIESEEHRMQVPQKNPSITSTLDPVKIPPRDLSGWDSPQAWPISFDDAAFIMNVVFRGRSVSFPTEYSRRCVRSRSRWRSRFSL